MYKVCTTIITRSRDLPAMTSHNFFHSPELFRMIESTPGQQPYMAIAQDASGRVVGHILASVRCRYRLLPLYFFTQGRVYGEGEYAPDVDAEEVFGELLRALTAKFRRRLCLFVEFSDITHKMFGYKHFRANEYFPIRWLEVHNSLHSMAPADRITGKTRRRIVKSANSGITTREVTSIDEVHDFYTMLRKVYHTRLRRFLPGRALFDELYKSAHARIYITLYHRNIIGGCACIYTHGDAYLWFHASKSKRYAYLHPNAMTIWQAMNSAYDNGCRHFYFLDAGLPFRRNPFREFILGFGGKTVSKYRWFRFNIPWINQILSRWYTG